MANEKGKSHDEIQNEMNEFESLVLNLPAQGREAIQGYFRRLEELILKRGIDQGFGGLHNNEELGSYIGRIMHHYNDYKKEVKTLLEIEPEIIKSKHQLSKFFDKAHPGGMFILEPRMIPKVRLYEFDGFNTSIYTSEFHELKTIAKRKAGQMFGPEDLDGTETQATMSKFRLEERRKWEGEFRDIAKDLVFHYPYHEIALYKVVPEMNVPNHARGEKFLEAYLDILGMGKLGYKAKPMDDQIS